MVHGLRYSLEGMAIGISAPVVPIIAVHNDIGILGRTPRREETTTPPGTPRGADLAFIGAHQAPPCHLVVRTGLAPELVSIAFLPERWLKLPVIIASFGSGAPIGVEGAIIIAAQIARCSLQ